MRYMRLPKSTCDAALTVARSDAAGQDLRRHVNEVAWARARTWLDRAPASNSKCRSGRSRVDSARTLRRTLQPSDDGLGCVARCAARGRDDPIGVVQRDGGRLKWMASRSNS